MNRCDAGGPPKVSLHRESKKKQVRPVFQSNRSSKKGEDTKTESETEQVYWRTLQSFSLANVIDTEHKVIYAIKFCSILPPYNNYFASAGSNFASIYRIVQNATQQEVELVQAYADSDSTENYYTVTWADKGDGVPLLVMAGKRGIIKVINASNFKVDTALIGHGNEILDITTHPVDNNLIISASKDESVRLWNIKTEICIAIFGGEKGHRGEVLSVSVHPCGNVIASGGMDNCIKLWNLVSPDVEVAIAKSYSHCDDDGNIAFVSVAEQFPIFSTDKVHNHYVDSVKWVGDCILSKSLCNRAALWTPDPLRAKDAVCILREFGLSNGTVWFMKMSASDILYVFAVGNYLGRVELFHLMPPDEDEEARLASEGFLEELKKVSVSEGVLKERFETGVSCKPGVTLYHDGGGPSDIRDSDFSLDGNYFIYCSSLPEGNRSEHYKSKICIWNVENVSLSS